MKKRISFKRVYIIYLFILILASIASIAYVNVLLHQYEELRPERCIEEAINELTAEATQGIFWEKYKLTDINVGDFEKHRDVQSEYLALYTEGNLEFSQKSGTHQEDELYYLVENDDIVLAEIKLKAKGSAVTKLAVFSFREWQIEYVKPIIEASEYTISVPVDFCVSVNDITLTTEDGVMNSDYEITYTIGDLYLKPTFDIKDQDGNEVAYTIDDKKVNAEFYQYTLTLPDSLTVNVNGEAYQGTAVGDNRVRYDIRLLEKPEVTISDYYGNAISYEGGNEIPLTNMTITADSRYIIEVSGNAVPKEAITIFANKEYEYLADYVENLPQVSLYDIAILENDAKIVVTDMNGENVPLEQGKNVYDFTLQKNYLDGIPEAVSSEIDVLEIAQLWSLFMSNDVHFKKVEKYLIADSYQYEVAKKYATGEDITFTSQHTLANPAFTDSSVENFVWISDNCFSVDISFVKHMILRVGSRVDDRMNDRFYFVKYDDTDDDKDNPTWKIVSMKEIVNNEK